MIAPTEIIVYICEIRISDASHMLKNKLLLSTLSKTFHAIWNESIWEHLFVKKYQNTDSDEPVCKFFNTSSWKTNYIIMDDSEYYLKNFTSTNERNKDSISYYNKHYQVPLCGDIVKIKQDDSSDYIFMLVSGVSKDKNRKDTLFPHKLFFSGLQVIEGKKEELTDVYVNKLYIKRENLVLTNNFISYNLYGRKSSPKYFICNPQNIY